MDLKKQGNVKISNVIYAIFQYLPIIDKTNKLLYYCIWHSTFAGFHFMKHI